MKVRMSWAAAILALGLVAKANAETVGAGVSILDLDGANIQVDTSTDGETDQSRQNLDISFTATLGAGDWAGTEWTYRAGQTGSVIPYLAIATDVDKVYEIVAVGDQVDVGGDGLDMDVTVPFGGSSFSVDADTVLYGGIVNPTEIGSQNPVYTNLNSGSMMDHDNNADGMLSPAVVGGNADGFGHANLARSYAFSINVEKVPEPTTAYSMVALLGLLGLALRRRMAK
ncbi:PEP-CTERM sorting domain-containing protein [Planctomycetota bacterium]